MFQIDPSSQFVKKLDEIPKVEVLVPQDRFHSLQLEYWGLIG